MAFNDARCPKCNTRLSWTGKVTDCPPCKKCGHVVDPALLAKDQAEMDAFEALLEKRSKKNVDG